MELHEHFKITSIIIYTRDLQNIHRLYLCMVYFWSQNNIMCINENLCPSTESVTTFVPIRSKK